MYNCNNYCGEITMETNYSQTILIEHTHTHTYIHIHIKTYNYLAVRNSVMINNNKSQ